MNLEAQDLKVKAADCTLETGLSTFGRFGSWPYRCEPGSFCEAANDLRIFDLKSALKSARQVACEPSILRTPTQACK